MTLEVLGLYCAFGRLLNAAHMTSQSPQMKAKGIVGAPTCYLQTATEDEP
jgi:hypothetical protein